MSSDEEEKMSLRGIKDTQRADKEKISLKSVYQRGDLSSSKLNKQRKSVKEVTFTKKEKIADNISIAASETSQSAAEKLK